MLNVSYSYLREFTPRVLAAIDFDGATAAQSLREALEVLRGLNAHRDLQGA